MQFFIPRLSNYTKKAFFILSLSYIEEHLFTLLNYCWLLWLKNLQRKDFLVFGSHYTIWVKHYVICFIFKKNLASYSFKVQAAKMPTSEQPFTVNHVL